MAEKTGKSMPFDTPGFHTPVNYPMMEGSPLDPTPVLIPGGPVPDPIGNISPMSPGKPGELPTKQMPLTDASNPQGMMGQQAPALGTEAPQGAGMMASPSAGLPAMAPGSSGATQMIAQIAANLLKKQQGVKYGQALLKHLSTILTKYVGSAMLEDPSSKSDVMDAIKKLEQAGIKLGKTGPTDSPALSTSLADMVGRAGNSGATS